MRRKTQYDSAPWKVVGKAKNGDLTIRVNDFENELMGDYRGTIVADFERSHGGRPFAFVEATANARHIVSCVNGCSKLVNPALEVEALLLVADAASGLMTASSQRLGEARASLRYALRLLRSTREQDAERLGICSGCNEVDEVDVFDRRDEEEDDAFCPDCVADFNRGLDECSS